MSLLQSIKQAKELGLWIHERTNNRNIPSEIRQRAAVAILQQSLDINDAIIILLEQSLPGPALALARPLFETYVRGTWLLNYATNKEIDKFIDSDECPNFPGLLKAIGDSATSGGAWILANKNVNLDSFHSLTHGGSAHVRRRVTQDAIEPNYPESELETLIQFGIEVRIRIGAELLALMNDKIALEELHERSKIFRVSC